MIENERFRKENNIIEGQSEQSEMENITANSDSYPMIAKTLADLEDVLAEELINLGANDVEIGTRMVSFTGDKALMYKANVHCRTALRILKPFYAFKAESADEVYEAVKSFNWDNYLSLDNTFSIDAVVFSHIFNHSKFVAYRVKDAIADWFTEKYEKRPSVSVSNPDIQLHIHVAHNKCTLSLDSSGESLHKRGYRVAQGDAPLNEVLAAGMILKSGWKGECDFIDPMCGSGTLPIEAAMIALGIPPGIHRSHFAFEKWKDFDSELFSSIYNDDSGSLEFNHRIMGFDISPKAIAVAEMNIKNAGLKQYIDLEAKSFRQFTEAPAPAGIVMTNPPYGERLKVEDLDELYAMIGERLKHLFAGYRAYVLSYRKESFDAIGLKHSTRFFLYNGALECEMREYEIFSGKRDDRPAGKRTGGKDGAARHDSHYERNSREGYRRSQRANETAGEEKSRDYDRAKKHDDGREKQFNSRQRSTDYGDGSSSRSGRAGDKPYKSRERSSSSERKSTSHSTSPEKKPRSYSDSKRERDFNGDKPFKTGRSSEKSYRSEKSFKSEKTSDKPYRSEKSFKSEKSYRSEKSIASREKSASFTDNSKSRFDKGGDKPLKSRKRISGKESKPREL